MAYNTGNPVEPDGSDDPRDLVDNAQIYDLLVNGPLGEYLSRLGYPLKSWRGILKQVTDYLIAQSYESIYLVYGAGIVVDRQTQLVQRSGELYRVTNASDIPLTLTGVWATDAAKLQAVGDAALRQALAATGGSAIIGTPRGTLEVDLLDLHADDVVLQTNINNAIKRIPVSNHAQPLMAHSSNVINHNQGVVVLGDSISHGAYAGNCYTNAWVSLLAKAVNAQFGAKNIGVMPMDALYNPVSQYLTDQIHDVTWSTGWGALTGSSGVYNWPLGNTGTAAGDAVNGKTVSSSVNGSYVEFTVPSINKFITIYYVGIVGGGKFDVSVNGAIVSELNTAVATVKSYNLKYSLIAVDGGQGTTTVRLTKKDALPTELQSIIGYTKTAGNLNEHFGMMTTCNFSISGRQLQTMTEASIIQATNCAALVVALGYNDVNVDTVGSGDAAYALFQQRINWLIQYALVFKCFVVVADFCWYAAPTSRRRTELKRLADATFGTYIGFPDKIYPSGSIVPDISPSATELVDPLLLHADNAHPSYKGNEMVFHEVAKALGLNITSKSAALLADQPFPLKLAGTLKNKAGDISTVSWTNNGIRKSLGITANGGVTIPSGTTAGYTIPAKFAPGGLLVRAGSNVLASTSAGAIVNSVSTLIDGSANLVIVVGSNVEGTLDIALNAS